ncbi:PIN domain-containing protein [Stakelama saccharophila]|uniref:PIN domain-containing protein n=1 Tax=Stakelama saccharophila TaxID=3075605 RepID=A0ABZ0B7E2_9SPHN|nr:PIN domain-containing protein [Stakelama sp. W311]WNO53178.1 PIN domain-containing protein [Stakelama sp. W311]
MTTIFIDTNIIYTENFFRPPWVKSFLKACDILQISVVIPEVVVDEVKGNFLKEIVERYQTFQKSEKYLGRLVELNPNHLDITSISAKFNIFFDQLLDEHGVIVAPYPDISLKEIVKKSYEQPKPFKEGGEGHKDFLIWETVKCHILDASTSGSNILLTNNIKDFSKDDKKEKNTLHPDLATQIEPNALRPSIHLSMKAVLDAEIMPLLEGVEIQDIPSLGQPDIEHITDSLLGDDLPQRTAFGIEGVPFSNDVSISGVGEAKIESVKLAKADDQIVINIAGTVEIEVDGFIDKFDFYHAEEMSGVSVWDHNWNDHVAAVSTSIETPFELSVFYSLDNNKVVSHEIVLTDEIENYWEN